MTTDITAFYIVVFLLAAFGIGIIAIGISYWLLFLKYKALREEAIQKEKNQLTDLQKIVEDAKQQSLLVLHQAEETAKQTVAKASEFNHQNQVNLETLVSENLQMHKSSYDQALSQISQNIQKTFAGLPAEVQRQLSAEMQKLIASLESQIKTLQESVNSSLGKVYEEAFADAQKYKNERIKAFEDSLFETLQRVSREVLRKELTIEEHEKLVLKALEKAKSEKGV